MKNHRAIALFAITIFVLLFCVIVIPSLSSPNDDKCMHEMARMASIRSSVEQFHKKFKRYPNENNPWKELALKTGNDKAQKDFWGFDYQIKYLPDDSFSISSEGFETICHSRLGIP